MSLKERIKKILPHSIWLFGKKAILRSLVFISGMRYDVFGHRISDSKKIPIVICNFNRLSFLCRLIESLEIRGYRNIHIIDNNSTYPPLLEYYNNCKWDVIRLKENVGYMALWKTDVFDNFRNSFYVYTDSDMEIDKDCPDDFISYFLNILERYPFCQKVGFGIRIDDLPDKYLHKTSVCHEEKCFWENEVEPNLYRAKIDTTFALYRPYCKGPASDAQIVYRTGFPYVIRHLPWYVNSFELSEEEQYYVSHISQSTQWSCRK